MRNLGLILARGGSKRIPAKNTRIFHGRPIIEYAIQAARESALFDRLVVSTDSEQIAAIANAAGAETPFTRPDHLSGDRALPIDAVLHALDELESRGDQFDNFCFLYATAPFVRAQDLKRGLEVLCLPSTPCALAVTDFDFPILRALRENDDGSLRMFWPEYETTRSNDLPHAYHDAGQFVWMTVEAARAEKRFYVPGMRPVSIPRYRVQDIDTEEDWARAEKLYAIL